MTAPRRTPSPPRAGALSFALGIALGTAACGDDPITTGSGDDDSEVGETGDDAADDDGAEGAEAEAGNDGVDDGGSDGETPEPEFEPIHARDITVTTIRANQGVAVPVYADGAWVGGEGRNAQLVRGRNTLLRGFWELAPGFEPRIIEARMTIDVGDGTVETAVQKVLVEGPPDEIDFDRSFYFVVPGELITPETTFQLELFETDWGYEDTAEPDPPPLYPALPEPIGIEQPTMELSVTLVPIDHRLEGSDTCPAPPELTEDFVALMERELFQQNPVGAVNLTVREPFVYEGSTSSFGGLLVALAGLRDADQAPPGEYYYGLIVPCDGGPDGVGGQAIDIPGFPSQENGWSRTSVGRFYGSPSSTASTFVHEVGHTQGRRHIACSGMEGGADPSYPYTGGVIGVWGFGVLDFTLHKPSTAKDYMTYCGNTWISDWGWRNVFPYIEEITTWSLADAAPAPTDEAHPLLVGVVDPATGEESWLLTTGTANGRALSAQDVVEVETAEGDRLELTATRGEMGDGGYNLTVELPEHVDARRALLTHVHEGQRRTIALATR